MNFKGKNKMKIRKITIPLLLVLLLSNFSHSGINVVTNQDIAVVSVSREEIRQLYLMKKRKKNQRTMHKKAILLRKNSF